MQPLAEAAFNRFLDLIGRPNRRVALPSPRQSRVTIIRRMKIYSWNVNGIRAVVKKGTFQKFIAEHQPDILCLQETKAEKGQAEIDLKDYHEYWNSAEKKGYSGTAIFTRRAARRHASTDFPMRSRRSSPSPTN